MLGSLQTETRRNKVMKNRISSLIIVVLAALLGVVSTSFAAVPAILPVQAALLSNGGGPVADGVYQTTFTLHDGAAGKILWTEGPVAITVKGGLLAWNLGSKTPLASSLIAGERWLQLQIGIDPALPAVQLHSVPFAVRSAVSEEIDCSGCIKAGHLDAAILQAYAKASDLAQYAKTADVAGFAKTADLNEYVKASSLAKVAGSGSFADLLDKPKLADVAVTGNYADLNGLPVLAQVGKACGTGLFMRGIKADGSYDCAIALDPSLLPKDGLDEVSNGLLSNQFTEVASSVKVPVDIPDGLAAGVSDAIEVPDFGIAQGLTVSIHVTNSDLSKVRVTVFDPNGVAYKVFDQNGPGKELKATYPTPDVPKDGDLTSWVGKNAKGTWSISVADLVGGIGKNDGQLVAWSINVKTMSNKKVQATGALVLANLSKEPFACTASVFGAQYASSADKALYICNGSSWFPLQLSALGTKDSPAVNCKDLLTKAPLSKSGGYWVDPDGGGQGDAAYQVYCDMTTDGGGWTLVWSNLRGGAAKPMTGMTWSTAVNTLPLLFKGSLSENLEAFGVYTGLKRWAQLGGKELRYTWSTDFGTGIAQSYRCGYLLNSGANYTITFNSCAQLVGSVAPGLVTYSGGRPFTTFDADNDAGGGNCATNYGNTPWWYGGCWDGSINGGGENQASGHYNGAYWSGSASAWAAKDGTGAGNGWIFVR